MFNWLKVADKKYKLLVNGAESLYGEEEIGNIIKNILKKSPVVKKMFDKFNVSLDNLNNLQIKIEPLGKQYALTDGDIMKINSILFDDANFFEKYIFVLFHEIFHFIKRKSEENKEKGYLYDPEEGIAFSLSIAHYLEIGKSIQDIFRDIYPQIEWHIHDENNSIRYFKKLIRDAKKLL